MFNTLTYFDFDIMTDIKWVQYYTTSTKDDYESDNDTTAYLNYYYLRYPRLKSVKRH